MHMEKQVEDLKLYASPCSAFCLMVELALKLKGVAYEYVQEDLLNKSHALLSYNPVHKKVPVLVHHGRPIFESFVILQYIDETWSEPPLLPTDAYGRARVRFWVDYYYSKLSPVCKIALISRGEELNKTVDQVRDVVATMEEGLKGDFFGDGPFFNGATPGLLDVVLGSSSGGVRVVEDLIGVELVDRDRTPFLSSRLAAFAKLEVARETLPAYGTFLNYARSIREKFVAFTRA
ncbi:hypothetical protein Taro_013385 [Colocasia esculenta]|uniref:Glutathione S-transferase n=1 Tax=Colocasia esculenta TaxID=4460 RepID=A0A843UIK9_COLES|nr:hypothetical protein [Colocasia esculenta]